MMFELKLIGHPGAQVIQFVQDHCETWYTHGEIRAEALQKDLQEKLPSSPRLQPFGLVGPEPYPCCHAMTGAQLLWILQQFFR